MGYSCTARAKYVLDQVEFLEEWNGKALGYKYFFEIGKENRDGAITGRVFEITGESTLTPYGWESPCKRAGTFRIEPDGTIKRFTGVPKKLWGTLYKDGMETYDREFNREWKHG